MNITTVGAEASKKHIKFILKRYPGMLHQRVTESYETVKDCHYLMLRRSLLRNGLPIDV